MAVTGLIPGRWLEAPAGLPLLKPPHSPLGGSCGREDHLVLWRSGGQVGGGLQAGPPVLGQSRTGGAAIHGSTGKRWSGWGSRAGPQATQRDGAGGTGSKERP